MVGKPSILGKDKNESVLRFPWLTLVKKTSKEFQPLFQRQQTGTLDSFASVAPARYWKRC